MSIKTTQAAIEAGARALGLLWNEDGPVPTDEQEAAVVLRAAIPHLQDCKFSPEAVQSSPATATQVAIDDAEVERVARAMCFAWHEAHEVTLDNDDWTSMHPEGQAKWKKTARAAIRAIREGGQRWGVWNCDSLSQDNAWYWWRKNHGERRHFVTFDEEAAHAMVNQLNADCNSDKYEVRPYPGEREKTPDEVAADWVNEIRYGLCQERVKEIQAKLVAAIRDAKGGK